MEKPENVSAENTVERDKDERDEEQVDEAVTQPDAEALAGELDALRAESRKNLDGWQRALAEFQNYKRRTERESHDTYQNATSDVLKSLLPIIDDFERAMDNVPESLQAEPWLEGVTLIQRKFARVLEEFNVTAIDPVGEPFDPNLHQAIGAEEDTDVESEHVAVTLQKGYVVGERVLRPAMVKVAR